MLQKRALMERRWQEGGWEVKWVQRLGLSLSNYYCYELTTDVQQRPSPQTFGVNIQVHLINCLLFLGELKLLETLNVSCNNLSSLGKLR